MMCFVVCGAPVGRSDELAEAMLMVFFCGFYALQTLDVSYQGPC